MSVEDHLGVVDDVGTTRSTGPSPPLGPAHAARPVLRTKRLHAALTSVAVVTAIGLLTAVFWWASVRAGAGNSDGASAVLAGGAMGHGHLLLHGWTLPVDSYWTVDDAVYAVAVGLVGVRASLLHLVPAAIAALVVVVGALMAGEGRRGWARLAAGATVVLVLGLPSYYLSSFLLLGPDHVGTALWCLLAFWALRWRRRRLGWCAGVALLAAAVVGDPQAVAFGAVPVFCAGLAAAARRRNWRAGVPAGLAALCGVGVAAIVRWVANMIGTFQIGPLQKTASLAQMWHNLGSLLVDGAHMLGVGGGALGTGGVPSPLEDVRVVGLLLVIAALAYFVVRLVAGVVRAESDGAAWLDDVVVTACVCSAAVFVGLSASTTVGNDRYLTPAVVFGAVLAGRLVGRMVPTAIGAGLRGVAGVAGDAVARAVTVARAVAVAAVGAVVAAFALMLTAAAAPSPVPSLVSALEAHGLHRGIGDYWSASITTVVSDGGTTVRPVVTDGAGRIVPFDWQSSVAWYRGHDFQFLVYNTVTPSNIDSAIASATFGPVERTLTVGRYRVLIWSHDLTVGPPGSG